ncbi:MAG TPA: cytochrome c biogenesis protein/redoxin [Gemmatimonadales bacterium]|jgi:cytochrome c biogenesis protein CcdA/thiol-disulfide isomerase/thioredoxin
MREVTLLVLAFLGGVLTILSPCILPVIPLVFARVNRDFRREIIPMLGGLALAFTCAALIATATARWLLAANEIGRDLALALLAVVGVTLLLPASATLLARPLGRIAGRVLSPRPGSVATPARNVVIGAAIGLLWAPCAGPILGLLIAAAATSSWSHAALLYLSFALGAIMSLAIVTSAGRRLIAALRHVGTPDLVVRRVLGVATLVTVLAIVFGWDQAIFGKAGLVQTASAEEVLVSRLAPQHVRSDNAGLSLDQFAAQQSAHRAALAALPASDGVMPGFDGATEWINSPPLTAKSLRGKVVLVEFWTFACYNCLNALPHIKALYAKYKDRGFVVIGVHTPELARERVPENVRREVKRLGIEFPVVIDNDNRIWNAYHNEYWPAMFYVDASGQMRFHMFGEGRYGEQDNGVAALLDERDAMMHYDPGTAKIGAMGGGGMSR